MAMSNAQSTIDSEIRFSAMARQMLGGLPLSDLIEAQLRPNCDLIGRCKI
jgi:hypothetical protein